MRLSLLAACAAAFTTTNALPGKPTHCLPIVDLGYVRQQAIAYDSTTEAYKFQNIRYAQPPVGDLRFRAPRPPLQSWDAVEVGTETRICPQAAPAWQLKGTGAIRKFLDPAVAFSIDDWEKEIRDSPVPSVDMNPNSTEDCLFLDVHVPKAVFERKRSRKEGAPVLVWIHGGGYVLGSKNREVPSGLLRHAARNPVDNLIVVSVNYRLGALGFLSGPEVDQDGDLNAGLLDQRLALNWVQENIHIFGGSKHRVTVMGESAGGGSALYQLTAYGGIRPAPFSQIIAQSPALIPSLPGPNGTLDNFLSQLGVESLAEARGVDEESMIRGNEAIIGAAAATSYLFGPVVDGDFMRQTGAAMLRDGKFDRSVKLLAGHNSFEGSLFFDSTVETEEDFRQWLERSLFGYDAASMNYIATTLYPPQFDGKFGYSGQGWRQRALWTEAYVDCSFSLIGEVSEGHSFAYEFAVSPGVHTQDLGYTFNYPDRPAAFPAAQDTLQQAIVSFAQTGVAAVENRELARWGVDKALLRITESGGNEGRSTVNETRCSWWRDHYH